MSSEAYHSTPGTYSSSQLKDAVDDVELFYKKYITKEIPKDKSSAFDVGTYVHTGILEPHLLTVECCIYQGRIRRGKAWELFAKENKGKAILTKSQGEMGDKLIKRIQASPNSMRLINGGESEVTIFVELIVYKGDVYCNGLLLTDEGWTPMPKGFKIPDRKGVRFIVKCRADKISFKGKYILDIKTTTGNARSAKTIRDKISYYDYDLSAAFYTDVFVAGTMQEINKFYWTFASKDYQNCKTWEAHADEILIGRAKWKKAILAIARGLRTNWAIDDSIEIIRPNHWEYEHIKKSYKDIL